MTVFTIGHSTRSLAALIDALKGAGADAVADIRRFPRSRRHPYFNSETLAPALSEAGIAYRHCSGLGGRRAGREDGKPSPHTLWREPGFRNFADYAETDDFRAAFAELTAMAEQGNPAILCAEAVWWRCHRRIVTDYLIAAGTPVVHIFDENKRVPAVLTPEAVRQGDGTLLYAGAQGLLL